jgi:hypothetical protein
MMPYNALGRQGFGSYVECSATLPDGKTWRNVAYMHDNYEIIAMHKILCVAHDAISYILDDRGKWSYKNVIE